MSHGAMTHGTVSRRGFFTLAVVAGSMMGSASLFAAEPSRNKYQPVNATTVVAAKPVANLESAAPVVSAGSKTAETKTAFWGCYRPVSMCQPSPCYQPVYRQPAYYNSPVYSAPVYTTPGYGMPTMGVPGYAAPAYGTPTLGVPYYGAQPVVAPQPYVTPGLVDPFAGQYPVANPGYFGNGIQPAIGSPYFP